MKGRTTRGRIEICVEDEGVGLPSGGHDIFGKFVQGEAVDTRTHDEGGMGLGLYIVRAHVIEMGGAVRAEPRPGSGARFVVALKRAGGEDGLVRSGHLRGRHNHQKMARSDYVAQSPG